MYMYFLNSSLLDFTELLLPYLHKRITEGCIKSKIQRRWIKDLEIYINLKRQCRYRVTLFVKDAKNKCFCLLNAADIVNQWLRRDAGGTKHVSCHWDRAGKAYIHWSFGKETIQQLLMKFPLALHSILIIAIEVWKAPKSIHHQIAERGFYNKNLDNIAVLLEH